MNKKIKLVDNFFHSEVDNYKKEFYESGHRSFMSVRLDCFMKEIDNLKLPAGSSVLDAGCGPGYMTKAFHDRGFKTYALDASPEMLRLTRNIFKDTDNDTLPTIVEGDIEKLPFDDNSFDLIASAGVIEYLATDKIVFDEFNRILKPGGYLVLSSTNKYSPIGILEPIIEGIKKNNRTRGICNWFIDKIGGTPIRSRDFQVRKHSAKEFILSTKTGNFELLKKGYFYALPWPHPFDRVFPKLSNTLGNLLEPLSYTPVRFLLEGIYIVANKK